MTDKGLETRVTMLIKTQGQLPPCNGILLHLEDFRELVGTMANNHQVNHGESRKSARRYLKAQGKRLYFMTKKERILVKPVLTGLPLGSIALELQ
jgi:hypothetical protein